MKRILRVFWVLLLLTACAAEPQEIPQEAPAPVTLEPEPAAPEPMREEPDFSPVNPNPVRDILMEEGKRTAQANSKPVEMPAAPFVEHDTFYFPLQFVAEAMGIQYAFADSCAYLQWDGHVTQFFIDSPRFIVDGVEGRVEGERRLYRKGLPQGPVDEYFMPRLRDGVVFLPVEYLPVEFRMSYNSFGPQIRLDSDGNRMFFQNDRLPPTDVKTAHAVTLYAGVCEALADGERVPLPAAPFVENEIFYFPVEAMADWMEVGYSRTGDTFSLFTSDDSIRLFLNSRQYVLNGQTGQREGERRIFTHKPMNDNYIPVDDTYVPVERDGVVFLPSDFFWGDMGYFFLIEEYPVPQPGMVIFMHRQMEELGIGGFYLRHKFDETQPELRAGLQCIGNLGALESDPDYDIIGYTGNGLEVHVLRLRRNAEWENSGSMDGTISAVLTTNPEFPTPRGLRCGDMPRRAWELYGTGPHAGAAPVLRYECPDNGPVTAVGFAYFWETSVHMGAPYETLYGKLDEWFETPGFWES